MLVILNGLPGCGKTFYCNLMKNQYQCLDEDREIVEALLQCPDYLGQQQGFTGLWLKMLKDLVLLWGKDPNAIIIFVCSLYFRKNIFWNSIRANKPYNEWQHLDQQLEILMMIESYIFAKIQKVININMTMDHNTIIQQIRKRNSPGDQYINEMFLQCWEDKWQNLQRNFGHVLWQDDNKFKLNLLDEDYFLDNKKVTVSRFFYLSEAECPTVLLTPIIKEAYELLTHVRTLHPSTMNINAVRRAIAQTPWLITDNTTHLESLVTERLSEEINGELHIRDIVQRTLVPALIKQKTFIAYQKFFICVTVSDAYSPCDSDLIRMRHEWTKLLGNHIILCHLFRMRAMKSTVRIKLANAEEVFEDSVCDIVV